MANTQLQSPLLIEQSQIASLEAQPDLDTNKSNQSCWGTLDTKQWLCSCISKLC